ncbi:MAG: hypothetical protein ACK5S6_03475 [bacterium]
MPVNRIARFYPETIPDTRAPVTRDDDDDDDGLQAAYLSGYADSEARYCTSGIRAALCYISLISGLVGFIVGTLIAGMP